MVIINSFKQLFRKPGKILLFILLTAASTLLLVFGAGMYVQTVLRIDALKDLYSTIATVHQPYEKFNYETVHNTCWGDWTRSTPDYGDFLTVDDLNFPGAEFVTPPESRPFMLSYMPDINSLRADNSYFRTITYDLIEFQVKEGSPDGEPAEAVITKMVFEGNSRLEHALWGDECTFPLASGDSITVCQHGQEGSLPLETGKTYMGYLNRTYCEKHEILEFVPIRAPFTSQHDAHGNPVETDRLPMGLTDAGLGITEVDENFYAPGGGLEAWNTMLEEVQMEDYLHAVLPVSDADTLRSVRHNNLVVRGRMITDEEFASGAKVCMISEAMSLKTLLWQGRTVKLSLIASMYGFQPNTGTFTYLPGETSLLDAQGEIYEPFWEAEYEIVGVFKGRTATHDLPYQDMFIIPSRSVGSSDENNIIYYGPMNELHTTFRLPNGTAEAFAAALKEAVPQSERLNIRYDDMGYANAVESLDAARDTAFLLLLVGALAASAIVVLLLYFFVVLEKKRTAIERSLGMNRRQCRASLLAGLLTVTLLASLLGSLGADLLLKQSDALSAAQAAEEERLAQDPDNPENSAETRTNWDLGGIYHFSGKFSPWAMWDIKANQSELLKIPVPLSVFLLIPVFLWILTGLLATVLVNRNLSIEPILLLNTRA